MILATYSSKHTIKKGKKIFLNFIKPLVALSLLFIPAAVAVIYANKFADWLVDFMPSKIQVKSLKTALKGFTLSYQVKIDLSQD